MHMKQGQIPGFFEKRKVLFSTTMPAEEIEAYVQVFLDEGRTNEALDFLEKTKNKEMIALAAKQAWQAGDVSVWIRANRLMGEKPTPEMWEGIADQAMQQGKEQFAVWAFDQAGKGERADAIRGGWQRKKFEKEREREKEKEKP